MKTTIILLNVVLILLLSMRFQIDGQQNERQVSSIRIFN